MTITGTILNTDGTPYVGIVSFASLSTPFSSGGNTVTDKLVKKQTSAAGALPAGFSLAAGFYRVNTERDEWLIEVVDGAGSVNISSLTVSSVGTTIVETRWSNERIKEIVQKASVKLLDGQPITVNGTSRAIWPDLVEGVYTTTHISIVNTVVLVDGFTITHPNSGKMVTQPQVTRDVNGRVIAEPDLLVTYLP